MYKVLQLRPYFYKMNSSITLAILTDITHTWSGDLSITPLVSTFYFQKEEVSKNSETCIVPMDKFSLKYLKIRFSTTIKL